MQRQNSLSTLPNYGSGGAAPLPSYSTPTYGRSGTLQPRFNTLPALPVAPRPSTDYSYSDRDCDDIGEMVWVGRNDPHNLDADGDGWGCEIYEGIEDLEYEIDNTLDDIDRDSPFYSDVEDLLGDLDDSMSPDDLDWIEAELDDLRDDIDDYEDE